MNIFITGISGFIGYHLAKSLFDLGHIVTGIDNLNNYYDVELKKHRQRLLEADGIHIHNMSTEKIGLIKTIEKSDIIVHLAAHAGVRASLEKPYDYIQNNIVATQKIIDTAEKHDIPVVFASSSSVYSDQIPPFTEDMKLSHHKNPYAWSKYVNECQFKSAAIPSIGFRFFTVYGPYGRPDMALYKFTKNIIEQKPIDIYNNGDMTRDFTYIQDIINGILLLIERVKNINGNEIYNIGSGDSTPLMDFVDLIEKHTGRKAIKNLCEMHPADVQHTLSDLTKIKELGYKPQTNVDEGIEHFVTWYKRYHGVN